MTIYYDILDKLEAHFNDDDHVNTVTRGDIFDVDLRKQTIFSLAHIMIGNATAKESTIEFNVTIVLADLVSVNKKSGLTTQYTSGVFTEVNMAKAALQSYVVVTLPNHGLSVGDIIDSTDTTYGTPAQFNMLQTPVTHVVDVNTFKYLSSSTLGFQSGISLSTLTTYSDVQIGVSNEVDVLNSMLMVGIRCVDSVRRGDMFEDNVSLLTDPTLEPFTERFENVLAGWTLTFDIAVQNTMTIC